MKAATRAWLYDKFTDMVVGVNERIGGFDVAKVRLGD